jgi:subtilase family serine protease
MPVTAAPPLPRKSLVFWLFIALLCIASLLLGASNIAPSTPKGIGALAVTGHWKHWNSGQAPSDAACRSAIQVPCYSPQEMRQAYDLASLVNQGYDGKGQTIVIIDSFGSPTAEADLKKFDADYGLPDPPSFRQLAPIGSVPFDPNNDEHIGWAEETSLDIQWAHAMAPAANIVVLTSPVSETQGVQGMPEFLQLEQYALSHHLGQIISQSWGTTENTLFTPEGQTVFNNFERFYQLAALNHISIFASSGDAGSANPDVNGNIYPFPTVGYPSSSPWVTAVGGTSLYADTSGNYQKETVWNDGVGSATGGGVSQHFGEPVYQKLLPAQTQKLLKGHRGLPDIAMNADPETPIPVYLGFLGAESSGYYLFGGTSESAPLWAGLTADANQYAGHSLGFLNPELYLLGLNKRVASDVFHDITVGNNAQGSVSGYSATTGWDATTGWGSPIAQPLFRALRYYSY